MTTSAVTYREAGHRLLAQARRELDAGDLRQASEKGWGAAAQMVEAAGESRGWRHNGHAHLFRVIDRLVDETGDQRLHSLFHIANSLHVNFYEDWMSPKMMERGLLDVALLAERLESLRAPRGPLP